MARFISKANTLLLHRQRHHPSSLSLIRHRSSHPTLIELDLSSSASSSPTSSEYDNTMKMFDDLIHRILVKKATPDWLPFVPGSSFWVPPRPTPSNVVDLVNKLTDQPSSAEDSLSLATLQGWPSSKFFLKENETASDEDAGVDVNIPEGMEGTVKVKVLTLSGNVAQSEDEEG